MVMKTPEDYFSEGRDWLVKAEQNAREWKSNTINTREDKSANLAMLAIASALLALCSQFIQEQEDA